MQQSHNSKEGTTIGKIRKKRRKSGLVALVSGAAVLASWYAYAAASKPEKTPYDLSFWRAAACISGTALSAWLTVRRAKAAVPVAIATAAHTVFLGAANIALKGSYVTRTWEPSPAKETLFNQVMPVVHVAGSAALVGASIVSAKERQSGAETIEGPLIRAPWYERFRKHGLYFMGFSMVGHWVEILFCLGIKHGIFKGGYDRENHMLWDQWMFPFPAEGTAAVLADMMLMPAKDAIQAKTASLPEKVRTPAAVAGSFLANQAVCTAVDFGTGMVANRNYELWDYRDMRFNFMGQVCLQNSLFYSTLATWGVWQLLPALEKLMERAGDTKLDGILVGAGSFFLFLELLYHIVPKKQAVSDETGAEDACSDSPDEPNAADTCPVDVAPC